MHIEEYTGASAGFSHLRLCPTMLAMFDDSCILRGTRFRARILGVGHPPDEETGTPFCWSTSQALSEGLHKYQNLSCDINQLQSTNISRISRVRGTQLKTLRLSKISGW